MSEHLPRVSDETRAAAAGLAGTAAKALLSSGRLGKLGPYLLAALAGSGLTVGGVTLLPPADVPPPPVTVVMPGSTNTVSLADTINHLVNQQRLADQAAAYKRGERSGLALARRNTAQDRAEANRLGFQDGKAEGRAEIRAVVDTMAEQGDRFTLVDALREIDHVIDTDGAP